MAIHVAVAGATGRLGRVVCEVIEESTEFVLAATLTSASSIEEGSGADVLVDVTTPASSADIVARALSRGQRVLVGTSGWNAARLNRLAVETQEHQGAVLVVPNFSLGSVLGTALSQVAAAYYDSIEIVESHHAAKLDAPSGTAVRTAEGIAAARQGRTLQVPTPDQPARGELIAGVPVHSLRQHGVVAKQEVRFGGAGETLTITHDTNSNDAYRAGILIALRRTMQIQGLEVGLEHALDLHMPVSRAAMDGSQRQ